MSIEDLRAVDLLKKHLEIGLYTIEEVIETAKEGGYRDFLNYWILETYNK